jgi:DNA helicase HerA-like ATPase
VLDEVWQYCNGQVIPDELQNIAVSGRKRGLKLFVATQQPQRLNMTIKTCMSELVCFRLQGDGPLDFAKELGFNREEVANLQSLEFVARNLDSGGELRGKIKI